MPLDIPLPTATPQDDISQYIPLLLSAIGGFLQTRDVWASEDYSDAIDLMEDLKRWIVENIPPQEVIVQEYARDIGWFSSQFGVTVGNALAFLVDTAQVLNGTWRQNAPAWNDALKYSTVLEAGQYRLTAYGITHPQAGLPSIYINGVFSGAIDWYSAAVARNVAKQIIFCVTESGPIDVEVKVENKNPSSTGYFQFTSFWQMKREGDCP